MKRTIWAATVGLASVACLSAVLANPKGTKPITEDGGQPVGNNQDSRTAGERGPVLLDNFQLIQKLARFDRERIPERVVHARGVGAHGVFESYDDYSAHTRAKPFAEKGKKTPTFLRFSTVIHPKGSPEQLRDPRGFAVKFYTEEGNWDLVGNNLPVFFIRDAMKFPDLVHAFKPSPVTNEQDPHRIFDFLSHVPESTHMLTFLYSDQGTPASLRKMDGFGVHAFKWVNAEGKVTYVKFNWRSMQGHATYTADEANTAAGANHTGLTHDLYAAINKGDFPSWELGVQMLAPADLDKFDFDPLDDTKVWPGVKEIKVGKLTLNKVPANFFQFTEQVAFAPGMMIPGIEASEDKMLQGRLFSYPDTQRYRLGVNYLMLPVNRPLATVDNNNQDGFMNFGESKGDVNYEPSIAGGRRDDADKTLTKPPAGAAAQKTIQKTQNFKQAGEQYRAFSAKERENLVKNLAGDMKKIRDEGVKLTMISHFLQADEEYGTSLAKALDVNLADVKAVPKRRTTETK